MTTSTISIPFAVDLASEAGWKKSTDQEHAFWIIRTHFQMRERQADDTIKMGNKLVVVESPTGVSQEYVRAIKTELTLVQFRESFREAMQQDESLEEFATTLATGLGTSQTCKLSSELKSTAQQKLTNSFTQSYRIRDVVTKRVEETYEIRYRVDPTVTDRLVAVAAYQRYEYHIYLTWIDYLLVIYKRTTLGLRKKRYKDPIATSQNHPNWEKFNLPLATAYFWKPLPTSSLIVPEHEYRNEVKDPEEIEIVPPQDTRRHFASRPSVPTLYQLSNVAFPLKWIHRKGDWTEEDLKRIEEEESRKTAWFWAYGPGRNQKQ